MAYDLTHGICDHRQDQNPLSTIAMHDHEKYYEWSSMYKAIERYHKQDIGSRFNISLTEYLEYPRDIVDMMTDIVIEQINIESRAEEHAKNDATKQLKADQEQLWKKGI